MTTNNPIAVSVTAEIGLHIAVQAIAESSTQSTSATNEIGGNWHHKRKWRNL